MHSDPADLFGSGSLRPENEQQCFRIRISIESVHLSGTHLNHIACGNRVTSKIDPVRPSAFGDEFEKVKPVPGWRGDIDTVNPALP